MSTTENDEFYFEDDSEYDGYPGCSPSSSPILDPLILLNPDRLRDFQYEGSWQNYDSLQVVAQSLGEPPGKAFINNKRVPINKRTNLYEYMEGLSELPAARDGRLDFLNSQCPYCSTALIVCQSADGESKWDDEDNYIEEMDEFAKVYSLEYCDNCRYWRWHDIDVFTSFAGVEHTYKGYLSKIKEFDSRLPEGFAQEFARWIRADERRWHTMNTKSLEHLVADIFRSTHHPAEVFHVGQPDDGGVDVVFVESENKKWLIQVKRREKATRGESVGTLRNLVGTMVDKDSLYGIIVSTADHFTYRAYEYMRRQREKGFFIELIDKGKLNRMLDSVLPSRPWLNVLEKEYPDIAREFDKAIPKHIEDNQVQLRLF
ncbi:MAG TPA: restriction endonuclease [Pyrinomonadaceae bacterium]|nr:restriction endonuclease [Pyrinomonadaceae bacterium]